jgi:flagellar biosynthesis/type III secretory pathway protein FliH
MKRCLVHPPHDCSCAEYELRAEVERLRARDITDTMVTAAKRVLAREYRNTDESWDRLIKQALREPRP